MQTKPDGIDAENIYAKGKNDHKIINSALVLQETEPQFDVVLIKYFY